MIKIKNIVLCVDYAKDQSCNQGIGNPVCCSLLKCLFCESRAGRTTWRLARCLCRRGQSVHLHSCCPHSFINPPHTHSPQTYILRGPVLPYLNRTHDFGTKIAATANRRSDEGHPNICPINKHPTNIRCKASFN